MDSTWTRRNFLSAAGALAAGSTVEAAAGGNADRPASPRPKKIIGVSCSPRKGKSTAIVLRPVWMPFGQSCRKRKSNFSNWPV